MYDESIRVAPVTAAMIVAGSQVDRSPMQPRYRRWSALLGIGKGVMGPISSWANQSTSDD
jgi:hypothetical protein